MCYCSIKMILCIFMAPNEMMHGVLEDLLPDLDLGKSEMQPGGVEWTET